MDLLRDCLPDLKYIHYELKGKKRDLYIRKAPKKLIKCLANVALNLLFSHLNNINLNKKQIKKLKPHKTKLKKLVSSRNLSHQRKLLIGGGLVGNLLEVLGSVIGALALGI